MRQNEARGGINADDFYALLDESLKDVAGWVPEAYFDLVIAAARAATKSPATEVTEADDTAPLSTRKHMDPKAKVSSSQARGNESTESNRPIPRLVVDKELAGPALQMTFAKLQNKAQGKAEDQGSRKQMSSAGATEKAKTRAAAKEEDEDEWSNCECVEEHKGEIDEVKVAEDKELEEHVLRTRSETNANSKRKAASLAPIAGMSTRDRKKARFLSPDSKAIANIDDSLKISPSILHFEDIRKVSPVWRGYEAAGFESLSTQFPRESISIPHIW